jgi:hypothetical protein
MASDFDDLRDTIDAIEETAQEQVSEHVDAGMADVSDAASREAQRRDLNATGRLMAELALAPSGGDLSDNTIARSKIELPEQYKYLEYGTGTRGRVAGQILEDPTDTPDFPSPANPPVEQILDWMLAKGVPPRTGSYYASAEAIAQDIALHGTTPKPFLRSAWRRTWRDVYEAVIDGLDDVGREVRKEVT